MRLRRYVCCFLGVAFGQMSKKTFSDASVQITGLQKIGWMHVRANGSCYIGAEGVGDNGLELTAGDTYPVIGADLSKFYVSGNTSVSFIGGYSN